AAGEEQQFRRGRRTPHSMLCAASAADEAEFKAAFAKSAQPLYLEPVADAHPDEVAWEHHDRFFEPWRRILDLAAHHVLPHRFVAVLANRAALRRRSREYPVIEISVIAQALIAGVQLVVTHEAAARRAAHLEHQRDRHRRVPLRPVECAFGKISDRAG